MNTTTLHKKILLTILLLWGSIGWTQEPWCIVYDDLTLSERTAIGISEQEFQANKSSSSETNSITPSNYTITPKKFRVNFWSIQNDEGTEGVGIPYDVDAKYLKRVNKIYEQHQICFVLNGNGILKHSNVLNEASHSSAKIAGQSKNAYADDAINVYIAKSIVLGADGITNYYDNSIAVKEGAIWSSEFLLAHELAHALGIMHTIGSQNNINASPNGMGDLPNCEHRSEERRVGK